MSSKPIALFSTSKKAAHPEKFSSGLCTSFLPSGIEKTFIREVPEHQLRIAVRPFCVATDVSILFKWLSQEYAGPLLLVAPLAVQDNILLLIQTCLEYFFSFPEVGRIIVNIEERNEYNRQLFKKAGFRSLYDIRTIYRSSSLYGCTTSHFRQLQTAIQ